MHDNTVMDGDSMRKQWRKRGVALAVGVLVLLLISVAVWWAFGSMRARGPVLDELMPHFSHDAAVSPVQVTGQVCPHERCVSAWDTELGTYLEFETQGRAEYLHQVLGDDSRINGNLVLDLTDVDLDRASTERAVQLLFHDNDVP